MATDPIDQALQTVLTQQQQRRNMAPDERDLLIRTVIGESRGQPPEGQRAVAHVVLNRRNSGKWGQSVKDVVLAKNQFEPWMTRAQELQSIRPEDPVYQQTAALIDNLGEDPTGGATHFANVDIVRQRRGGDVTDWMKQMWNTQRRIGDHTFFGGDPMLGSVPGPASHGQSLWALARGGSPHAAAPPMLSADSADSDQLPGASLEQIALSVDPTLAEVFAAEPTAPGVAPAAPEPPGGVSNVARGAAEQAVGIVGSLFGFTASVDEVLTARRGERLVTPYELAFSWALDADPAQMRRQIEEKLNEQGQFGYEPRADAHGLLESIRDLDPVEAVEQIAELFFVSAPWMATSLAGGGSIYAAAMGEQIAKQRAENSGREDVTDEDLLVGLGAAAASAALERAGVLGLMGRVGGTTRLGAVARATGREALTEAVQEPIEYAGETVGTDVPFDPEEAAVRGAAGAIVGAGGGGVVAGAGSLAGVFDRPTPDMASPIGVDRPEGGRSGDGIGSAPTGQTTGNVGQQTGPVAPEGSVLERLGGVVSEIKTKFRLSPQEEQKLHEGVAVVKKNDIARTGYLKFETGPDVARTMALANTDEKDLLFLRAPKNVKDKSALLGDIAKIPDLDSYEFSSRIKFVGNPDENVKDEAELYLRSALDQYSDPSVPVADRIRQAEEIYRSALDLGLRFQPDESAGFITPEAPQGIVPVAAPRTPSLEGGSLQHVLGLEPARVPRVTRPQTLTGPGGNITGVVDVVRTSPALPGEEPSSTFVRQGIDRRNISINSNITAVKEVFARRGVKLGGMTSSQLMDLAEQKLPEWISQGWIKPVGVEVTSDNVRELAELFVMDISSIGPRSPLAILPDPDMVDSLEVFHLINPREGVDIIETVPINQNYRASGFHTNSTPGNDPKTGDPVVTSGGFETGRIFYSPAYYSAKKVMPSNERRAYERQEKFVHRLLTRAIKELGLKNSIALGFYYGETSRGKAQFNQDGTAVLWLSLDKLMNGTKSAQIGGRDAVLDTFVHEFGHVLSGQLAHDKNTLKRPFLEHLLHQYEIDLLRIALNSRPGEGVPGEVLLPFFSPFRLSELRSSAVYNAQTGLYRPTEYYMTFEEWMAENTVKWIQRPPTEVPGALGKFFKIVANRLAKFFKLVQDETGFYGENFDTSTAFNLYMEYTRSRVNPQGTANFDLLYQKAMETEWSDELKAYVKPSGEMQIAADLIAKVSKDADLGTANKQSLEAAKLGADYYNSIVKWGWNIIQLAWKNPHIRFLQQYVGLADRWQNKKSEIQVKANERLREWKMLGKDQMDATAKMLFAIDNMEYLTDEERRNKVSRKPTDEELSALARKYKLNEYSFGLVLRINEDFQFILSEIENAVIQSIQRNASDPLMASVDIARVQKEFEQARKRPYFPHARFGQFTVVVRDKDGKTVHMEQFKSARERTRNLKAIREQFEPQGFTVGEDYLPDTARQFMGLPPSLLQMVKETLQLTDEQKAALDQLMISTAPGQSFRKHFLHRQNVPGYSLDAMRAYGDYFWHASNHIARITFGQQMQEALKQAEKDISALRDRGGNVTKRRQIQEFLQDHLDNLMNPGPDWAWARSFAFNWWIAGSVASAALNLTQVPMVAYPYLSARFGDLSAINALKNAAVWVAKVSTDPDQMRNRMSAEDFAQITLAQKQMFIDESQSTELAGIATGGNLVKARHGSALHKTMTAWSEIGGWFFAASERYNRRLVFRAAVQLARANPTAKYFQQLISEREGDYKDALASGMSSSEALAFIAGKDAVYRSQFEYSAWARPRFMRGRKSSLFAFFMFKQNMLWFAMNSPGNVKYLLMLGLAGGLMGLPGAEDLAGLMRFFANKIFGKHFDLDLELRKFMVEAFGSQGFADLTLHGAARYGFGLPQAVEMAGLPPVVPSIDMSQAISQGRMIPGLSELGRGEGFEDALARSTQDVSGAAFGPAFNLLKFLSDQQLEVTDPKRWERILPRALRDLTRAQRYYAEEEERSRTGASILKFDLSDPFGNAKSMRHAGEITARGLGFNPTRMSLTWDRIIAQREVEKFWMSRRTRLMQQFWNMIIAGDKEGRQDTMRAIREFNKEVPAPAMAISPDHLTASIKERMRRKRLAEAGVPDRTSLIPVARQTQRLYPDPENIVDVEDTTRMR